MKQLPMETLKMLNSYMEILFKWNKKVNLTSYTKEELIDIGILDAYVLTKVLYKLNIKEILDVGTGYGMPGIIVKIFQPSINVSLLDGSEKKIAFLEYVSKILHIPMNIYFKHLPDKNWDKKFSCIVSKASMKEEKLIYIARGLLNKGGYLIYFSSSAPKRDNNLNVLGCIFYKRKIGNSFIIIRKKTED
ncbi:MAG: 16S rRNA (guanine(527)-N(7))-methyltransferase RsmG [Proteobacteria bacterium]|nr:16S rRNA (guanine(527)-N(7))-methyltransferase RsmG [Pseudomonadota bacterium]